MTGGAGVPFQLGTFGEAFIWEVPNRGPVLLANVLIDLDGDTSAVKSIAAVALGPEIQ